MTHSNKTRRQLLSTAAGVSTMTLAGCMGGNGDGNGNEDNQNLIAATSGEGTVGFTVLQAHSRTLQEADTDLSLDVQARGNAAIDALGNGEADLAYTNSYEYAEAMDGRGRFSDNSLDTKPHQLHMFYAGNLYFAAQPDADIETISDFAGMDVSISEPGVSFYSVYQEALKQMGVYEEMNERRLPIGNLGDAFANGRIDVAVVSTAANQNVAGYASQVIERSDHDLVQLTDEEAEQIAQVKGLTPNTYETKEQMLGENDPSENVAMDLAYGLTASPDLSSDVAYEYNEVLVDNKDSLADAFGLMQYWDKEAMYELCLEEYPIHSGAVQYYKDQGWWSDDYTEG